MGSVQALVSLVLRRSVGIPDAYERIGSIHFEAETGPAIDHVRLMYSSAVGQLVAIV